MLRQAYKNPNRTWLGPKDLQRIFLASVRSYDKVFLLIDALDECPEIDNARQTMLEYLTELGKEAPNLRILITSRATSDIRDTMFILGADPIVVAARKVDPDIEKYVSAQLSRDRKLSRLDPTTRKLIEDTLSQKADGM